MNSGWILGINQKKEKNIDFKTLMEARLERIKNVNPDEVVRAKLLQLKLRMEEYNPTKIIRQRLI
ncbi:MAG: hypothetical protein ACI9IP_002802 [Arcticibacterium sp.]